VRYINPDSLNKNPAFTNVVVVEGNVKTVVLTRFRGPIRVEQ
jgi:hypothetical protein